MFNFLRLKLENMKPIDLTKPDAIAIVTNCRASENPFGKNYRACALIKENYLTSACLQTLDGKNIEYEKPTRCYINFLSPEFYKHTLWENRKIELYEGKYLVGTMTVEKIFNAKLDRDRYFSNDENILLNKKILNIALKRNLEFGRKIDIPLDIKIMHSVNGISGFDIDRIAEYIEFVRDDIICKIYCPNWDAENQKITVDAEKIVKEKYPWISKNNLADLDSQGHYYAWHG